MKKSFKKYAENRIAVLKYKMNSLSDDAKAEAKAAIDELNTLISDMESEDEEYTTSEALQAAVDKLNEKIEALKENTTTVEENSLKGVAYLKSENSLHDFLDCIRSSKYVEEVAKNWNGKLSQNGITIASGAETNYMPEAVKGAITDAWERNNWLNKLKNTGAKKYLTRINTTDQDGTDARAKGHKTGTQKQEEVLTFGGKTIDVQYIYKLIYIDNITQWNDDGTLLQYIVDELMTQWIREVQRAVLVGDGRNANTNDKIKSVESILRASTDGYVTVTARVADATTPFIDQVVALRESVLSENCIAFMTRRTLNQLARKIYATGGTPQYESAAYVASQIGVDEIIITNVMGSNADIIMMDPKGYATVGGITPQFSNWENWDYNKKGYRVEVPFGGAVEAPKSAAVLTPIAG